jgi:hypothetical protein
MSNPLIQTMRIPKPLFQPQLPRHQAILPPILRLLRIFRSFRSSTLMQPVSYSNLSIHKILHRLPRPS